jgi:hypothetical protein
MGKSATYVLPAGGVAYVSMKGSANNAENALGPNTFVNMTEGAEVAKPAWGQASASTGSDATAAPSVKTYHAHLKAVHISGIVSQQLQSCETTCGLSTVANPRH